MTRVTKGYMVSLRKITYQEQQQFDSKHGVIARYGSKYMHNMFTVRQTCSVNMSKSWYLSHDSNNRTSTAVA